MAERNAPLPGEAGQGGGGDAAEACRRLEIERAWAEHEGRNGWRKTKHAQERRARLSERQNHRCCWCGVRMTEERGPAMATTEHIIPTSRGGSDNESNVAASCLSCNAARDDSLEWLTRAEGWSDGLLAAPENACPTDFAEARRKYLDMGSAEADDGPDGRARETYARAYLRRFAKEEAAASRAEWLEANNWRV